MSKPRDNSRFPPPSTSSANSNKTIPMNPKSNKLVALVLGVALVGVMSFVSVSPAAAQEKKQTVSKELAKTLKAAQEAIQGKNPKYAEALAKLKDAESNPKKTPYDQHIINELSAYAYAHTGNAAEAAKANEALVNDGFSQQSEIPARVKAVAEAN